MKIRRSLAAGFLAWALSLSAGAQVRGIDHVGMNVPNIDQAVRFFGDTFGFRQVTEVVPAEMTSEAKARFGILPDAHLRRFVTLRAGDGANLELFEYASAARSQPMGDDPGATHVAFYVEDFEGTVARLRARGLQPLDAPAVNSSRESWVYFATPWGSRFELIGGRTAGALWTPWLDAGDGQKPANAPQIAEQHLQAWSETDIAAREKLLRSCYSSEITFVAPDGTHRGIAAVSTEISKIQAAHPSFVFRAQSPVESSLGALRLRWGYGPPGQAPVVTGQDMMLLRDGKVTALYVFFGP